MIGRDLIRSAEPTDWRPWSWHEGDPMVIEFRDGTKHEIDSEEDPGAEWEADMWCEVSDELADKGIEADEETDLYPPGAQQVLNWRPIEDLPEWARPTPSAPAPASPPPRRGTA